MKKLLFLALFSFSFLFITKASNLPTAKQAPGIELDNCSNLVSIETESSTSIANLSLVSDQTLIFKDGSGGSIVVNMTVTSSLYVGTVLHIDLSTNANLNGYSANTSQQLDFIDTNTGAVTTVDIIITDQIIH